MSQPYQPYPQQPQRVTVKRGANHTLHVVLTVLTCGIWAITGWPIAAILGRKTTTTVQPMQQLPPAGAYGPPPPGTGPQAYGYQPPPAPRLQPEPQQQYPPGQQHPPYYG